ncbi:MAG: DNA repair exonuclease [Hydrogenophaga sp.]|nr:DNA repair exonuclease [Hydrogenophaga sp.]
MRFIHTADIHLDSPLRGLAAYPDAPAQRLRTATRDAFHNLVTRAIDEAVDFMVIAGDVYDGDWKDFNTGLFFVRQMGRLRQAGIPVYLLYGNHDAENDMTRRLELPDNVHVFASTKAASFLLDAHRVALHGRSFRHAATTENLLPGYPAPVPGWFNIGVLHTALEGNTEHASYAPCSVAELQARGYQYWALGHVHEHSIVQRGTSTIAYPGNLQGRHIKETGARGALLVSADEGEITGMERIEVDVLRWHRLDVDIGTATDLRSAVRLAGHAMEQLLEDSSNRHPLAVRVVFRGESPAHALLAGQESQLRQEVIAQAVALDADRLWVEKVRLHSRAPAAAPVATGEGSDALAELEQMALAAGSDPDFLRTLQADVQALLEKLPHDLLETTPELQALRQHLPEQLPQRVAQAVPLLMSRVVQASSAA